MGGCHERIDRRAQVGSENMQQPNMNGSAPAVLPGDPRTLGFGTDQGRWLSQSLKSAEGAGPNRFRCVQHRTESFTVLKLCRVCAFSMLTFARPRLAGPSLPRGRRRDRRRQRCRNRPTHNSRRQTILRRRPTSSLHLLMVMAPHPTRLRCRRRTAPRPRAQRLGHSRRPRGRRHRSSRRTQRSSRPHP